MNQAIPYILNNIFTKTEKDKEKLASVSEQGILAHINLKKFLKQIRIILDQMFAEAFVIEGILLKKLLLIYGKNYGML